MAVEQEDSGIYYLIGDAIPIQLVIVPKLSTEHNYWLNNLRNDLKAGNEIRNFIESYSKNKNSKLYQALADAVMRKDIPKRLHRRSHSRHVRGTSLPDPEDL